MIVLVAVAAAIKAVCTNTALVHSNALNQVLKLGKLQRCQSQSLGYLVNHTLVFRRISLGILLQILLIVALKVLDNASCYQFHITF